MHRFPVGLTSSLITFGVGCSGFGNCGFELRSLKNFALIIGEKLNDLIAFPVATSVVLTALIPFLQSLMNSIMPPEHPLVFLFCLVLDLLATIGVSQVDCGLRLVKLFFYLFRIDSLFHDLTRQTLLSSTIVPDAYPVFPLPRSSWLVPIRRTVALGSHHCIVCWVI